MDSRVCLVGLRRTWGTSWASSAEGLLSTLNEREMLLSVEVPCRLMRSHRAVCRRSALNLPPAQDLKERWCCPLAAMVITSSPIGWAHDEDPSEPNKFYSNYEVDCIICTLFNCWQNFEGKIQSFQCDLEQLNVHLSGENSLFFTPKLTIFTHYFFYIWK